MSKVAPLKIYGETPCNIVSWAEQTSKSAKFVRNHDQAEQNTQEEAFEQMDAALDYGVNFFDTAELYPYPSANTYGGTETIIGNWFAQRGQRDQVILATKVVGLMIKSPHIRWPNSLQPSHH